MADVGHLGNRIRTLAANISELSRQEDFDELLDLINRPGFTRPAELTLVTGTLDSMVHLTEYMAEMKQMLLKGSREVVEGGEATPS